MVEILPVYQLKKVVTFLIGEHDTIHSAKSIRKMPVYQLKKVVTFLIGEHNNIHSPKSIRKMTVLKRGPYRNQAIVGHHCSLKDVDGNLPANLSHSVNCVTLNNIPICFRLIRNLAVHMVMWNPDPTVTWFTRMFLILKWHFTQIILNLKLRYPLWTMYLIPDASIWLLSGCKYPWYHLYWKFKQCWCWSCANWSPPGQEGRRFADDILICNFVNENSCVFIKNFHWCLFLRVPLTMTQHWFREWLGAE